MKNNKGISLIVLIGIISILLIVGGGVAYYLYSKKPMQNIVSQTSEPAQQIVDTQPVSQNGIQKRSVFDFSKMKKTDKLPDGYLMVLTGDKSYLVVVPELNKEINPENVFVLTSINFPLKNAFTLKDNKIYYIDSKFESIDGTYNKIFKEKSINVLDLSNLKSKNLVKLSESNNSLRSLFFSSDKIYFINNSNLYELDINSGDKKILTKLPSGNDRPELYNPKEIVQFELDSIAKLENNNFYLYANLSNPDLTFQGDSPPGGFQRAYNLKNNKITKENFQYNYEAEYSCSLIKINSGKLDITEGCEKLYQNNFTNNFNWLFVSPVKVWDTK